jgi:dihydrofolate synthase/folylpolyglutamate synthase
MKYIDPLAPIVGKESEIKPGLERIEQILKLLGNPEKKFKAIHIAGTNGKGSTAVMVASILRQHGFKVGLYTSPHLQKVNERIKVGGEEIADERLEKEIESMKKLIEEHNIEASYFEFLTALAFKYFAEEGVDFAVVEAGLGGRWDATNILPAPLVCVITNIGLEHQNFLGDTREEIAKEKIEIIKKNSFVVTAVKQPSVLKLIEEKCAQVDAGLLDVNEWSPQFLKMGINGHEILIDGKRLELRMLGEFQVINAALAFGCYKGLQEQGVHVSPAAVLMGLREAFYRGRFEIARKNPFLIFDAAHNPPGIKSFVQSLKEYLPGKKFVVVFGASQGRDVKAMLSSLKEVSDQVVVSQSGHPNALEKSEIVKAALEAGFTEVEIKESPEEALEKALKSGKDVCVCGSIYFVGEAMSYT